MANGDLITKDYQWQLNSHLYGCGSGGLSLDLTAGSSLVGVLGVPDAKTQDVVLNFADGSYPNPDYLGPRVISIPGIIRETTAIAAFNDLNALQAAWVPLSTSTDLAFQFPGIGKFKVDGRPRGLKEDLSLARYGVIRVLLRFDALIPTLVGL